MEYDEALLSNLTVPELQQECKKRGLKKSGIKVKLIQRLAEHIEKYGPEACVPPGCSTNERKLSRGRKCNLSTSPPKPAVVEKSVNAIHNPHPYMAEYEEQLIEGANMEDDIDDYYSTKEERTIESSSTDDRRKVEHSDPTETSVNEEVPEEVPEDVPEEVPEPTSEPPSPEIPQHVQSPVRDPRQQQCVREVVDDRDEGDYRNDGKYDDVNGGYRDNRKYRDDENYENERDEKGDNSNVRDEDDGDERDPRDMAEELTEPIHQSPNSQNNHGGRIIEMPVDNHGEPEDEHRDIEDHVDHENHIEDHERHIEDHENLIEDHENHIEDQENHEDEHDGSLGDMEEKLQEKDICDEEEHMDGGFPEDDERHHQTRQDEEEGEGMEVVKEDVVKEALHAGSDGVDNEESEVLDYADADYADADDADADEASEMQYTENAEKEEADNVNEVGEEENIDEEEGADHEFEGEIGDAKIDDDEEENENEEAKCVEESRGGVANEEVEMNNEEGELEQHESSVEEEGEITVNSEKQNDLDESHVVGDDHLDVSIQDDKIAEDSEPEEEPVDVGTPKPPKKTVVPVSLKKRVSLVASTESQEEKAARRKRRWGATNTLMKDSSVPISSESIKKLIPDMKIDAAALESVPELDYQEDDTVEETMEVRQPPEDVEVISGTPPPPKVAKGGRTVKVDTAKKITLNKSTTSQEVVTVESDSGEPSKTIPSPVAPQQQQPVRTYVVDDEVEIQEQREKSPSPAKNPISQYINIENLVRPYTINQLKSIMRRTGEMSEGGFWINNIKSRCYVKFMSEEQATATRDALHGLRWPAGSPKVLKVDFALNEQMFTETEGLLGEKPKIVIEIDDKENDPIIISQERTSFEARRERKDSERSKSRTDKKKKAPKEPEKVKGKEKGKDEEREESPAKLLDDLFRKTKATPCIYWLPLTEEQVIEREKQAEQNRTNEPHNERSYDARDRMEHPNDRYSDRRSQQFRGSNRSWR